MLYEVITLIIDAKVATVLEEYSRAGQVLEEYFAIAAPDDPSFDSAVDLYRGIRPKLKEMKGRQKHDGRRA